MVRPCVARDSDELVTSRLASMYRFERNDEFRNSPVQVHQCRDRANFNGDIEWQRQIKLTPSFRQAARKKATVRTTWGRNSARSDLSFSPNSARMISGLKTKSMRNCVVVASRSDAKAASRQARPIEPPPSTTARHFPHRIAGGRRSSLRLKSGGLSEVRCSA